MEVRILPCAPIRGIAQRQSPRTSLHLEMSGRERARLPCRHIAPQAISQSAPRLVSEVAGWYTHVAIGPRPFIASTHTGAGAGQGPRILSPTCPMGPAAGVKAPSGWPERKNKKTLIVLGFRSVPFPFLGAVVIPSPVSSFPELNVLICRNFISATALPPMTPWGKPEWQTETSTGRRPQSVWKSSKTLRSAVPGRNWSCLPGSSSTWRTSQKTTATAPTP
jgi:hypothetical protein